MTIEEFSAKFRELIDAELKAFQKFAARRIGTTPDMAEIRRLVDEGETVEAQRLIFSQIKKELGD